jgi:phenylacetate-CoA ligase
MIQAVDPFVDQVVLFVCPSAIGHLRLLAEQSGKPLPLEKIRYVVIGEPFPESIRLGLRTESLASEGDPVIVSVFGSADTGVLGVESSASAMVRGWCEHDHALAVELGFGGVVPHLFHAADPSAFLETVRGELHVTKWQGVPLVRYNLHDAARLLSWREVVARASRKPNGHMTAARHLLKESENLPDIMAITGRADSCLMLCGTNLTEAMLDAAVRSPALAAWLTGNYRARVLHEGRHQQLEFVLECRAGIPPSAATENEIYSRLITALGNAQPEFHDDWENIYRRWDDDPALRVLALKTVAWPALAESATIKQRGIRQ